MNRMLLGFAACVIVAFPLEAQNRPLSYDDYYRIERAGATARAPDGRNVAFVRSRVLEEGNRTHAEVWMVDTDGGSEPIRLTSRATEASNPRWSPDGRLLSFSSSRPVAGEQSLTNLNAELLDELGLESPQRIAWTMEWWGEWLREKPIS